MGGGSFLGGGGAPALPKESMAFREEEGVRGRTSRALENSVPRAVVSASQGQATVGAGQSTWSMGATGGQWRGVPEGLGCPSCSLLSRGPGQCQ